MVYLHFLCNPKTVNVAQLVRALDCGSRGRGFESHLSPRDLRLAHSAGLKSSTSLSQISFTQLSQISESATLIYSRGADLQSATLPGEVTGPDSEIRTITVQGGICDIGKGRDYKPTTKEELDDRSGLDSEIRTITVQGGICYELVDLLFSLLFSVSIS